MEIIELDILSKVELESVKGGNWVYSEEDDEWYWAGGLSLDDPNYPVGM